MNPKIAVCLYGTSNSNLPGIQNYLNSLCYNITYFEHYEDDVYRSLWVSAFKKRQQELDNREEFDICLAVQLSNETLELFAKYDSLLSNITSYTDNKIYFVKGSFVQGQGSTNVSPQIFFSNSLTFDFACNFGTEYKTLPVDRKQGGIGTDFYYFLKTLKIKTECINFENTELFEII
jgi:hypothetical protein